MSEREELIACVREVANRLGVQILSRSEFQRHSGISQDRIYRHFDGWRELCTLAGVTAHTQNLRLDETQLFEAMRDAFMEAGGVPTRTKFGRHFRYSVDVLKKRGWNWKEALEAFRKWADLHEPNFPYLNDLSRSVEVSNQAEQPTAQTSSQSLSWTPRGQRLFGEFIGFRGLLHAPVNEQGVVFLFGMVAHELGYVVEMVTTGFPDCEAKRRVGENRWERVRVEFEFRSRNFRDHGHDPAGCDILVCWDHNWPECPVEVLELRKAINSLGTSL